MSNFGWLDAQLPGWYLIQGCLPDVPPAPGDTLCTMLRNWAAIGTKERLRRVFVLAMVVGVPYVPGAVALAMLLSGAD